MVIQRTPAGPNDAWESEVRIPRSGALVILMSGRRHVLRKPPSQACSVAVSDTE